MTDTAAERLQRTVERQNRELEQLRAALRTRELIDVAKGVLVERLGHTPEEAFAELQRLSQRTNTKLVRVAAALVAQGTSRETPPEYLLEDAGQEALDTPEKRKRFVSSPEFPSARAQLAGTLIRSAGSAKDMAGVLCGEGLGAAAAAIMSLDADGGLTLLGQQNLLPDEVTQWRRVPPVMDTYATRVAKARHAIVLSEPEVESDVPILGAISGFLGAHAVLPLLIEDRLIGVVELVWREARSFNLAERHHLASLAGYVARSLRSDWEQLGEEALLPQGSSALQALLNTLLDSAMILSPVREAGQVVDFLVDYVNDVALDAAGRGATDLVGRRLLELYPAYAWGPLDSYIEVLETGAPYRCDALPLREVRDGVLMAHTIALRASRFFDGVFVCWRVLDESAPAEASQAKTAEGPRS